MKIPNNFMSSLHNIVDENEEKLIVFLTYNVHCWL